MQPELSVTCIFVQSKRYDRYAYSINPHQRDTHGKHTTSKQKLFDLLCRYCTPDKQVLVDKMLNTHVSFLLDVENNEIIPLAPDFETTYQNKKNESHISMRQEIKKELQAQQQKVNDTRSPIKWEERAANIIEKTWKTY